MLQRGLWHIFTFTKVQDQIDYMMNYALQLGEIENTV